MHDLSLTSLSEGLRQKTFSSVELTQHFLKRIKTHDTLYNSFITVSEDTALTAAKAADVRLAAGNAPALCGVPIAHKDIFCTQGIRTSCASKMLDNFISPYDATVVSNMAKHGMVSLGKTNMDEFAMGSSNETSYYGAVKNPWNTECIPGGSSGGSAAAVAAHLCPAATASDTGGSIRQPAALCGLTGLKPTYGRISRFGMIAFASSMDQAGTMTHSAEEAALLLQTMAGHDPKDSTSSPHSVPDYSQSLSNDINGLTIGLPTEFFSADLDPNIRALTDAAINELTQQGVNVVEISLPNIDLSVPTYYVLAPAEASTNLSRFDGVRYGHRCNNPIDLNDLYKRTRNEGFGEEVKRRILIGTYVLSAGYYDAYYQQALKVRQLIKQDFTEAFNNVDVILCPSTPSTAYPIGSRNDDPVQMYLEDLYTIGVNLAGLPGMSIPIGQSDGLPVGMQLIGNYFQEERLLNMAHRYQTVTEWHLQSPSNLSEGS
ncbi:MAG: Asp-tRNA(Asn)/Glu-tRNA(Gln) amidotransferase subunit GatA [Pseudomonadota bacterium]